MSPKSLVGFVLQADDAVGVAGRGGGAVVGQQPLRHHFLAAEADHHRLAAEIGVAGDVAHGADRDRRAGGSDRHAATVGVVQRDDVVDVGEARQEFLADAFGSVFDDAGDALDGGGDAQQVAGAGGAVRIAESVEGVAFKWRQFRRDGGGQRKVFQRGCGWHAHQRFLDPASARHRTHGIANDLAVANDRRTLCQVEQIDLVALRHVLTQCQPVAEGRAARQSGGVDHDGHVVLGMNPDVQRYFGHNVVLPWAAWNLNGFRARPFEAAGRKA